ncbi:MAG: DNA/RNA nuclease SfsA, partial [Lentisphaeria bacterium]|nr:DNA/RNA nuclease SfsA [Lentisphaeria bacterium]
MAEEAIREGRIPELAGYSHILREKPYGRNSRIDLLLEGEAPAEPSPAARGTGGCRPETVRPTGGQGDAARRPCGLPENEAPAEPLSSPGRPGTTDPSIPCTAGGPRPPSHLCYVEVKNVSLLSEDGSVAFPDAVTERGRKHLRELEGVVRHGHRAVMLFVIQRPDGRFFRPAWEIDPDYGRALRRAVRKGVEVLAYRAEVSPEAVELRHPVPCELALPGRNRRPHLRHPT